MKRVAITGISGYIGGKLLARLDETEGVERIVGIDLKPPVSGSPKLKFYQQDISRPLGNILTENEVDSLVHLAFVLKPTHDRRRARQVDINGTLNLVAACRQTPAPHILYLSSHTVYGAHPDNSGPLREDSPRRPLAGFQYSRDKAEAEEIFEDFVLSRQEVCLTILRACPVIGPGAGSSVVTAMFTPLMIAVRGYDPPLQFVHEDDLTRLIITLLAQRQGGVFNVAGDGEVRYRRLAHLSGKRAIALPDRFLRFLLSSSWALRLQSQSPASGLEFIKYPPVVSTEKLKKEAGFRFRYSSEEAVASFLSARPSQP